MSYAEAGTTELATATIAAIAADYEVPAEQKKAYALASAHRRSLASMGATAAFLALSASFASMAFAAEAGFPAAPVATELDTVVGS